MSKKIDYTLFTKEELQQEREALKDKSIVKGWFARALSATSISMGFIGIMLYTASIVPVIVLGSLAVVGLGVSWGYKASSIDDDLKIDQIDLQIKEKEKQELYTQLSMEDVLKHDNKSNVSIKKQTKQSKKEYTNENNKDLTIE